jgi:hypothetical protein
VRQEHLLNRPYGLARPLVEIPGAPAAAKVEAARDIDKALESGWSGFEIAGTFALSDIERVHEFVEHPTRRGRMIGGT